MHKSQEIDCHKNISGHVLAVTILQLKVPHIVHLCTLSTVRFTKTAAFDHSCTNCIFLSGKTSRKLSTQVLTASIPG